MASNSNNRRWPAEWEPQSAILLTWPHAHTDWKDILDEVEQTYFDLARAILTTQNLILSCEDATRLVTVNATLQPYAEAHNTQLRCYRVPADDTWTRDHGPVSLIENEERILLDFRFNAWGDKFAANKDDKINRELAAQEAFGKTHLRQVALILEGGSIESDGQGTLLTTSTCLLNPSRNAGMFKTELEQILQETLGVKHILWLENGHLAGDDTDAHIDTLARFIDPGTICYVRCDDPKDEHFLSLSNMENELKHFRTPTGEAYRLIPLPMPEAIYEQEQRLPATYANFLITNHQVLVPVYGVPQDSAALTTLGNCFPHRDIVPIQCNSLIKQHGSLHCITMQISL